MDTKTNLGFTQKIAAGRKQKPLPGFLRTAGHMFLCSFYKQRPFCWRVVKELRCKLLLWDGERLDLPRLRVCRQRKVTPIKAPAEYAVLPCGQHIRAASIIQGLLQNQSEIVLRKRTSIALRFQPSIGDAESLAAPIVIHAG